MPRGSEDENECSISMCANEEKSMLGVACQNGTKAGSRKGSLKS